MYDKFKHELPYRLLDTSKYPPEVAGRFNSFITTQFDDSLSVEMQMRSIIKWATDNFKLMDSEYNDFTDYIINKNINPFIEFLNDLIEYMNEFIETFDERYQETILDKMQEWHDDGTLETLINESLDTKYHEMDDRLTAQLAQTEDDITDRSFNIANLSGYDTSTDLTDLIQDALDNYKHIFIPSGIHVVNGTIEVGWEQTIEFGNKVRLLKQETADNDDPILWLKGSYSVISGKGQQNTIFESEKPSPKGIIRIGNRDMTDTEPLNVLYNTVKNLSIIGKTKGGEQYGEPSYCLYFAGPENQSYAVYFNNISNIYFGKANVGLMMEGYANANIITNLQFWDTGNEKWLDGAAIKLKNVDGKYPLENVISNVFQHNCFNGDTMFFDGQILLNTLTNINAEPFGPNARWIRSNHEGTGSNIITGIDNVASDWSVMPEFTTKNSITRRSTTYSERSFSRNATIHEKGIINKLEIGDDKGNIRSSFRTTNMKEGTFYSVIEVDIGTLRQRSGAVSLEVNLTTRNGLPLYKSAKIDFIVDIDVNGNIKTTKNYNYSSFSNIIGRPVVNGSVISFAIGVGDNGTSTQSTDAFVTYSIRGFIFEAVSEIKDSSKVIDTSGYRTNYTQSTQSGATFNRPEDPHIAELFFDTTIGKPIWAKSINPTVWVDSDGVVV